MRTAELEVRDLNSAPILAGYQLDNGPEWHLSGVHYTGVLIAHGQPGVCQAVAREVYGLRSWSLHVHYYNTEPAKPRRYSEQTVYPDDMNGAVIDGDYLGFAEWLRKVLPRTTPKTLDDTPLDVLH